MNYHQLSKLIEYKLNASITLFFMGGHRQKKQFEENNLNNVSHNIIRIIRIMNKLEFALPQNVLLDIQHYLVNDTTYDYFIILWTAKKNDILD